MIMRLCKAIFSVLLLSLCACGRQEPNVETCTVPTESYILFNSGISTKTPIISDMRGLSFGVIGYKYTGTWASNVIMAKPFVDDETTGDGLYKREVACAANGVCSYSPVKQWESGQSYTFFAYYPYNYSGLTTSSDSYEGVPYIDYSLPASTAPADLQDVMYAKSEEDLNGNGSGTVSLTFHHALFCLNIQGRNVNEDDEKIRNVKIKFDQLDYSTMHIRLDGTKDGDIPMYAGTVITNREYVVSDATAITIPPLTTANSEPTLLSGNNNLVLIPQDGLSGTITVDYYDTENSAWVNAKGNSFTSDRKFEAGKKYSMMLNFAGDAITIAIIESGEWIDKPVDILFE